MNLNRLMKGLATSLLIGVAAGGAGMAMLARSAPPEPERTASSQPAGDRYRVTMAGGTTFEVVALRSYAGWWRPDGTPLDEPPADVSGDVYSVESGQDLLTVLVRARNLPKDATLKWVPTHDQGCYIYLGGDESGNGVTKDGKRVPDLWASVVALRSDRTTGSVQVQFAAGPWQTVASDGGRARFGGVPVITDGYKFYFGTARPYQGGTTIAVAHNHVDVDVHNRLMAVDYQGKEHPATYRDADARADRNYLDFLGKEHPASYSSKDARETLSMLDTEFALPPELIREYRVQSRPFERAEIKDIALKPRPASKSPSKAQAPSPGS